MNLLKTNGTLRQRQAAARQDRRGAALILALGMLVLMVALVVAFFVNVTADSGSSHAYAQNVQTRQLADSAVNLVESQIKDATAGYERDASGNLLFNKPLAWASQPGMIRTWNDQGNAAANYALYSAAALQTTATPTSDPLVDSGQWLYAPALYADLNSPVLLPDASGTIVPDPINRPAERATAHFPIIEGSHLVEGSALTPQIVSPDGAKVLTYDANGDGVADIEGFYVKKPVNYDLASSISPKNNPVPMPVRWLYLLQDGTLSAPTGSPGSGATPNYVVNVPNASTTNPIVGRMAFWTDDETCKLNLNTASEGTFWDTPKASSVTERNEGFHGDVGRSWAVTTAPFGYSSSVPVANEYQRTPGHPATTCLSSVLGWVMPPGPIAPNTPADYNAHLKPYYTLTPRVGAGGTQAGTTTGGGLIAWKSDRLYASIDELMFTPQSSANYRKLNNIDTSGGIGATTNFDEKTLEECKFFLTTSNAAPDTNLFNQPRLSLWPIQTDAVNGQNPKDKLLASCSTINGKPYYMQRGKLYWNNNGSPKSDDNNPGASQSLTDDSPYPSDAGGSPTVPTIPRNKEIYDYTKRLLSQSIPGYGGRISDKYPQDLDQILTEMYDTIRSQVNSLNAGSSAGGSSLSSMPPFYAYAPFNPIVDVASGGTNFVSGQGSVVPLRVTPSMGHTCQGFGANATLRQIGIVFFASKFLDVSTFGTVGNPGPGVPKFKPTGDLGSPQPDNLPDDEPDLNGDYDQKGDPRTSEMKAVILIEPVTVTPGPPMVTPWLRYQLSGLENMTVTYNGATMLLGFPSKDRAVNIVRNKAARGSGTLYGLLASLGWNASGDGKTIVAKSMNFCDGSTSSGGANDSNCGRYPFFSLAVPINPAAAPGNFAPDGGAPLRDATLPTTFRFNGGDITLTISSAFGNAMGAPIQTIQLHFPPADLPVPSIEQANINSGMQVGTADLGIDYTPYPGGYPFNKDTDGFLEGNIYKWDRLSAYTLVPGTDFNYLSDYGVRMARSLTRYSTASPGSFNPQVLMFTRGDTVRSLELNPKSVVRGDLRLLAAMQTIPLQDSSGNNYFVPRDGTVTPTQNYYDSTLRQVGGFMCDLGTARSAIGFIDDNTGTKVPQTWAKSWRADLGVPSNYTCGSLVQGAAYGAHAKTPPLGINGVFQTPANTILGDWNNGPGGDADGAYVNRGDQGTEASTTSLNYYDGYFINGVNSNVLSYLTSYSPNRQITSGVIFGSLPVGVKSNRPWTTLLFCPNPAAKDLHPGFGQGSVGSGSAARAPYTVPPDHVLLDLFTMPVVDPYAISGPFYTQGRVNMNYQMMPFTSITRSTGLRAVLKSAKLMAIPTTAAGAYKQYFHFEVASSPSATYRYDINPSESTGTLAGFEARFQSGDLFHSASEICNVFLVPALSKLPSSVSYVGAGANVPSSYGATPSWWDSFKLTGDNSREAPYNNIYPRLTTRSNTYTVHMKVQSLKKAKGNDPTAANTWDEQHDLVLGEYRGSTTIERYVDPNDSRLPDFATLPVGDASGNLDAYYRFRTLSNKRFAPSN